MISNVLSRISGIEFYGLLSVGLFLLAFLGMLWWALRLKKPFLDSMRALPLQDDRADSDERPDCL